MANARPTPEEAIAALGDPTRRAIVEQLRHGALPVGELAQGLTVSRPAVSQHLKILSDVGLLEVTPRGTRRVYALAPDGVAALRRYLDGLWDDALSAFAAEAETRASSPNTETDS
ncbi:metalloregulator ArsR/SmtB family transcription factor [Roseobacter sp. HKCCD9010]|uniref:ArsR/SmtB family transcription factor n=1 Tax=unclassified Roseobacter TaxID=196798 RepID=UPI0014914CCC|nr:MULTISPECIES: metalloregulator ArsR/SmtB family transcription factor [unclassified Roseobacter]MBF9049441.1 metalloregulator ArsR/SmtB family transcription factor [Rhodobacterales bacterium HKCCD4356]NNV11441.1 metalloregulator ArsR/SmtB family transcription factor [Roseobacter sp. HKCCD7357]NNV15625.1 metalloregulator ArsR/SmtB family transcription factor [Roseobacter sp. HKCCD8768]NNV25085.1 metalloregulator ArsR/SmtB family transcription factor [Roseobacter sp. HKCCD8192]NNV29342.1 metal